jgi:hypothetical protein
MLEPDAFKPKPLATIGDPKDEITYAAVGKALSRWEAAEIRVARLFGVLIGVPTSVPALRAYGAVATFQVRKQMVIAAADSLFKTKPNPTLHKKITDIFHRYLDHAAARRTEIAHGIVITTNPTRRRINHFLAPPYYSSKKRDDAAKPTYLYSSQEIVAYTRGFEELTIHIHNIVDELLDWRATWRSK